MKSLLPLLLLTTTASAEIYFEPWSYTEKDFFPSAIISTATVDWNGDEQLSEDKKTVDDAKLKKNEVAYFGDENGWLAVDFEDVPAETEITVEISVGGYMKPSRYSISTGKKYKNLRIFPKCLWDYEALHKVKEQKPVNATFKVTIDGEEYEEQVETCVMKSLNDCPFYIIWDAENDDFEDFSVIFTAYVNENHPWIDGILKEAIKSGLVSSFTGYQSGDPEEVIAQVFAVWNVLQRRGIKYSDISTTTPSKYVVSQTVRFLDDTIDATQANCVDGSVLMASILRKIGIESYLVMVPGHCFLAFRTAKGDDVDLFGEESDLFGLETTMLGNNDLKPLEDLPKMPEKTKKKEFEASFETFQNALAAGSASIVEHAELLQSGESPDTQMISVSEARELGIMPIASGREKK
jgi:hypothetical protein